MAKKFDNPKIEEQVVKLLENTQQPVSIDYVAFHLNVNWNTARSILLNMALKGRIQAVKTTKSLIFLLPEQKLAEVQRYG